MNKLCAAYMKAKKIEEHKKQLKLCIEKHKKQLKLCLKHFVCPNCTSTDLELQIDKYICPECSWSQAIR